MRIEIHDLGLPHIAALPDHTERLLRFTLLRKAWAQRVRCDGAL